MLFPIISLRNETKMLFHGIDLVDFCRLFCMDGVSVGLGCVQQQQQQQASK